MLRPYEITVKAEIRGPYNIGLVNAPTDLANMPKIEGAIVCAMVILKK